VSGGWGIAAVAVVLSAFSRRKLRKRGQPSNGEVVFSGGASVVGHVSRRRHGVRSSKGESHERKKKKERRSSFGDALLLKQHEAVDDGGVAAGTMGGKRRQQSHGRGQGGGHRYLKAVGTV
jgi:hypothetical protein